MKKNSILITVVIAVVVGALAFFGGMQFQKMQRSSQFAGLNQQAGNGQEGRFGGGQGRFGQAGGQGTGAFRPTMGSIVSVDDTGVTVKMPDGSSKIVVISGSTTINKQATGTKSDLKTGETIAVFGTTNSDGSVTAQSIQLNPQMRRPQVSPTASPK